MGFCNPLLRLLGRGLLGVGHWVDLFLACGGFFSYSVSIWWVWWMPGFGNRNLWHESLVVILSGRFSLTGDKGVILFNTWACLEILLYVFFLGVIVVASSGPKYSKSFAFDQNILKAFYGTYFRFLSISAFYLTQESNLLWAWLVFTAWRGSVEETVEGRSERGILKQ